MSEAEETAKIRGWKDKDTWVESGGNPEKWRPADEFLKRSEDHNGMLRENLTRVEDTLKRIQAERESDRKTFDEFRKFSESATKKAEERAYNEAKRDYDRQVADMKRELKAAAKDGDEGAVDRITANIDNLKKPDPPKVEEKKGGDNTNQEHPDFVRWRSTNTWYTEDPAMSAYADAMGAFVQRTKPHIVGTPAFFDEVLKLTKKEFPDKFEDGKKRSAVEGGGSGNGEGGGKRKTWTDLPEDAKKACNDFIKTIPGFTKEQYLKGYFGEA